MYDKDRADECNDIRGDQYNRTWQYGCTNGGLTKQDCGQIRNDSQDLGSHEQLQEQNRRDCYDDGFEDGNSSNPCNKDRDSACSEYSSMYKNGFSAGCESVEGNTQDSCQLTIQGHEAYRPSNPDDPACSEFLHDASIKRIAETVQFVVWKNLILVALKIKIQRNTASTIMIQHFVRPLSVKQVVL